MIVLKILLFILLAVLGLILLVLIIPVGGEVSFIGGKLKYKVSLWFINVMDSDGGGILGWLKKRKSKKKKHKNTKKKKVKAKKSKDSNLSESISLPENEPENTTYSAVETEDKPTEETTSFSGSTSDPDKLVLGTDLSEDDENDYDIPEDDAGRDDNKSIKNEKKDRDSDGEGKKPLGDKIDKLVDIWGSAKNPLCLIFKAFKFSNLYIDFVIADEDACKCALNYGRISAVSYRGLSLMSRIFTVRLKTVDIRPGFGMKKGRFDAAFKLQFRVGTFVIAGLWFLITYIFRVFIPGKLRSRKEKKSATVQK